MKFSYAKQFKIVVISALCLLLFTCSAWAAQTFNFKYASYAPAEHVYTKINLEFAKRIEEATDGKVKITVYPNAALCSGADQFKSVAMGMVDMTDLVSDYMVGEIEMMGLGCLPLGYDWRKTHLIGEDAREIFDKRLAQDNIKYLYTYGSGGNEIFVKSLKGDKPEFKGMKVRASGVYPIDAITAINATPIQMGTGEVYMSVETGLVDGALISVLSWAANTLYDVLPVLYDINITPSWFAPVINQDAFNRLPKDLQEAMVKTSIEFAPIATKMVNDKREELIEWAVKEKSCQIYKPTPEEVEHIKTVMNEVQKKHISKSEEDTKAVWEIMKKYQ